MSTLDRAFIRVFEQSPAGAVPTSEQSGSEADTHARETADNFDLLSDDTNLIRFIEPTDVTTEIDEIDPLVLPADNSMSHKTGKQSAAPTSSFLDQAVAVTTLTTQNFDFSLLSFAPCESNVVESIDDVVVQQNDAQFDELPESNSDDSAHGNLRQNEICNIECFDWPTVCQRLQEAAEDQFACIGARLLELLADRKNVVAVTGVAPSVGVTTVALCLARWALGEGGRVAVVDGADSGIAVRLCHDHRIDCSASETRAIASDEGVTVFCPAADQSSRQEMVGKIIRQIAGDFDIVIADVGPVTADTDSAEWSAQVHAAILVCDVQSTSIDQIVDAHSRLNSAGIEIVGVAENFRHETESSSLCKAA